MSRFLDLTGQGWLQLAELTLAFFLSALVGLEREFRLEDDVAADEADPGYHLRRDP